MLKKIYGSSSNNSPRYIEENYSKIRDVERELENLTLDMKLIAGPKKAGWIIILISSLTRIV